MQLSHLRILPSYVNWDPRKNACQNSIAESDFVICAAFSLPLILTGESCILISSILTFNSCTQSKNYLSDSFIARTSAHYRIPASWSPVLLWHDTIVFSMVEFCITNKILSGSIGNWYGSLTTYVEFNPRLKILWLNLLWDAEFQTSFLWKGYQLWVWSGIKKRGSKLTDSFV